MRRSILLVTIALAAAAASGASAEPPSPPEGVWELRTTRSSYSGPSTRIRGSLVNLIQRRVVFSPGCTQTRCISFATVRTAGGRQVAFVLKSNRGGPYAGRTTIATALRCAGRPVRATLELNVKVERRVRDRKVTERLVGATSRRAVRPARCSLFSKYTRVVQKTQFVGVAANG